MQILQDVKMSLRIGPSNTAFDIEVSDLIAAARHDLQLSGVLEVKVLDNSDPLIKRAMIVYCKANFGWDNPDAERFQRSYDSLKAHLTLSQEYTVESDD